MKDEGHTKRAGERKANIYVYIYLYIYTYICREREREREQRAGERGANK